jgi:hypothetical protein
VQSNQSGEKIVVVVRECDCDNFLERKRPPPPPSNCGFCFGEDRTIVTNYNDCFCS